MGVANCSRGGAGRVEERPDVETLSGASSGTLLLDETGFWLGDGGIARPRRGVRGPEGVRRPGAIGGLRSGAGNEMVRG